MHAELAEKLARLTTQPGVYQHKDEQGKVLYVGKAKNLKARVNSYFHDSRNREGRLKILVSKIFQVILMASQIPDLITAMAAASSLVMASTSACSMQVQKPHSSLKKEEPIILMASET